MSKLLKNTFTFTFLLIFTMIIMMLNTKGIDFKPFRISPNNYILEITSVADKDECKPGDTITYTVSLTNNIGSSIDELKIKINLSKLLTHTEEEDVTDISGWGFTLVDEGQLECEMDGNIITIRNIPINDQTDGQGLLKPTTFTYSLTVPSSFLNGSDLIGLKSTIDIISGIPLDQAEFSDTPVVAVLRSVPIEITKSANEKNPKPGDTVIYTVTVKNTGSVELYNVKLTDTITPNLDITLIGESLTNGYTLNRNEISIGSIPVGQIKTIIYMVKIPDDAVVGGEYKNTAKISATTQDSPNSFKVMFDEGEGKNYATNTVKVTSRVNPPVNPPVDPPVNPPVDPPVNPPVDPPVNPPVNPPTPIPFYMPPPIIPASTPSSTTINDPFVYVYDNYPIIPTTSTDVSSTETKVEQSELKPPVIYAQNLTIPIGTKFNFMEGITSFENNGEGNDITKRVTISGIVNTAKVGNYELVYKVTDRNGLTATKKIIIAISDKAKYIYPTDSVSKTDSPIINAKNITISAGEPFNFMKGVTAFENGGEGDNITNKITIKGIVNTAKPGDYKITYQVTDKNGKKATKTIIVTVIDKSKSN